MSTRYFSLFLLTTLGLSIAACSSDDDTAPAGGESEVRAASICGGIAGLRCPAGNRCEMEATHPDASGRCVRIQPGEEGASCAGLVGLQCNDGLTCKVTSEAADALGVCVKEERTSGAAGDACGSRGMARCHEGLACIFSEAATCGATDKPGHCFDGRVVKCSKENKPVCGCDKKTYTNECMANQQGASVAKQGACE